ncbi:MAG: polyphosphate polymerase domain-containing protein [Bacteroidales bacterium]|nr:polyphosphate polymerase domain-containing protein [Bacteroidales bacterium]
MHPETLHTASELQDKLDLMPPVFLDEMDTIKLMNRIDTKYVTNELTLLAVLEDARQEGYRVLEAEHLRLSPYNSLYFDTSGLRMFLDHHNRRLFRQKVRTRVYLSSGQTFLEIKRKNNHGRTRKKRREIAPALFMDFRQDTQAAAYLSSHSAFTAEELSPQMETLFKRITLVNPAKTERLTIDLDLSFVNHSTGKKASLPAAVIIELKQDGRAASQMKRILLRHRVKTFRISKYCLGTSLTNPNVKSNRFKLKIRKIEKITHHKIDIE